MATLMVRLNVIGLDDRDDVNHLSKLDLNLKVNLGYPTILILNKSFPQIVSTSAAQI